MDRLCLPPQGVYVIWDWNKTPVADTESDTLSESEALTTEYYQGEDHKEEDEKDEDTVMSKQALGTHTVTFKCIGATKDMEAQRALQRTSEQLRAGQQVPVDVFPEPLNQYDSRAFKVHVADKWTTIGYVV